MSLKFSFQDDMGNCAHCRKHLPARLLDAVILDEDGNEASAEAYCEKCWPMYKKIEWDFWQPLFIND